jgi:capsular exopolysaccharide synthesis family protein
VTLPQYLRTIRRHWSLVVLVFGLVGVAAAGYTLSRSPTYSASTRLFVSVRTDDTSVTDLTQGGTFTQQRVKSYANLLTSPSLMQQVIRQLGLTYTPADLAEHVAASNPPDSVLLEIKVRDRDPQRAADIANAIAATFPALVRTVENPLKGGLSPVKISVTNPATADPKPVSPHVKLNLGLGLLVGLGLGVGAAIMREQSSTTIRDAEEIQQLTGSMPLGLVPFDPTAQTYPLIDTLEAAQRAEAFRSLRTSLQFVDVDNPPTVIVVSSALPDEGKTSTACNLALTISLSGANVVLVDGDLRKPSVGQYLGISNAVGLTSVLAGHHDLLDVLVSYRHEGLKVLPSGPRPPNPSEVLGSLQTTALLAKLSDRFDIVIVDAPPLLPVTDAAVLAAQADGTVLVVRHGRSRREEVVRALQVLRTVNARLLGVVLNRVPPGRVPGYGARALDAALRAATPARGVRRPTGVGSPSGSPSGPTGPTQGRTGRRVAPPRTDQGSGGRGASFRGRDGGEPAGTRTARAGSGASGAAAGNPDRRVR